MGGLSVNNVRKLTYRLAKVKFDKLQNYSTTFSAFEKNNDPRADYQEPISPTVCAENLMRRKSFSAHVLFGACSFRRRPSARKALNTFPIYRKKCKRNVKKLATCTWQMKRQFAQFFSDVALRAPSNPNRAEMMAIANVQRTAMVHSSL